MPAAHDFRLYHSNDLDVLAAVLAGQVAQLPADGDWLRPDVVLVPQFSMRRWLQQAIAERSGICANLRFVTPGEFVDAALDANLGFAPPADRLAPDALRWHLLRELRRDPPPALAGFVTGSGDDPLRTWSLAGALADTYEKYQAWRRDWLLRWERGAEPDDWQAMLWRRIGRGRQHRARRIGEYLQRFSGESAAAPAGLPPRLFVFACQNVSPDVLQVIASQARAGEQHFYLHTPSRAFWGDLQRWTRDYLPADDDLYLGDNPLLAAWGQAGRDFIAALGNGEAVHAKFETAGFVEPPRDTLLGRLQADVLDNRAPLGGIDIDDDQASWPRTEVDRLDPSLQFHACHTRLREVQVLHDQLRALLEAPGSDTTPRLQPRDIAVLAPDIDLYAPHIEAVFGGALGSTRELPYTIADASPLASAPLAEAFVRLLELPLRPLTVADLLDLLAVPAIAARFDLDDHARGALQRWLEAAGARWGLDGADRIRHGAGESSAYTFEFALDRLLLGYASGEDDDIAGVAPWPQLEGQAATALDALLQFLALLRETGTRLSGPHPPAVWARELERLLEGAFGPAERDSVDARVLERLRECITGFADGAALAGYAQPVEHALLLQQLKAELGAGDARAPFLSGGICFGAMVPMRLIPFKAICLLGLDDGAFPARDGRDPINRIARQLDSRERQVGDPSKRDADRYLFLQLFASSGRVLYLSWLGMDPRDGSTREPSVLVSELLDAAARYHRGEREQVRRALVVRHALQPFSPAAYGAAHVDETGPEPRRFSFDPRWQEAALTPTDGATRLPPFFSPIYASADAAVEAGAGSFAAETTVSLQQLRNALLRPHALYLQHGLGLRLPEDEPPLLDAEPFGKPGPLAAHALRQAVFDAWLARGAAPDAPTLHAQLLARAQLAPGADGAATLRGLLDAIAPFAQAALAAGFPVDGEALPIELNVELDAGSASAGRRQLRGSLDGARSDGVWRVVLRAKGRHGSHVVRHGFERLFASLHQLPLHELAVEREGATPQVTTYPPLPLATAEAALRSLLALRERGLRAPLVFLPKSAHAFLKSYERTESEHIALKAAAQQWHGSDHSHAEAGAATQLALRGRDPFRDADPVALQAFTETAYAVFAAVERGEAFDAEALA